MNLSIVKQLSRRERRNYMYTYYSERNKKNYTAYLRKYEKGCDHSLLSDSSIPPSSCIIGPLEALMFG